MRSFIIALLGLFTMFGAGLGVVNGAELLSLYVLYRPYGTFYFPPLNLVGGAWIILGLIGILTGALLVVASVSGAARTFWVRLLGLTVYLTLAILSIYQTQNYFANASTGNESMNGLLGAIIGVLLSISLMTPPARSFFSSPRKPLQAVNAVENALC